jgi:calcium-dependent protein kinase
MGACGSAPKGVVEDKPSGGEFSRESSFYGKITQHNPRNAAGEMVSVTEIYDFDVDLEIGASSTGVVCKAIRKADEEAFALKVIHLNKIDEENREQLRSEIAILKSLDHPNIVKLFETYEHDNVLYMIMELCTGGELYGRLEAAGKRFKEKVASRIVRQMLSAVVYCHSKNIAHRDIKMANFLFKDESPDSPVKMIDFGYSKMMYKVGGGQRLETFVGTSYFIAPEVIAGAYSEKADIWSIGVMCFLMVVGYAPFRGRTPEEVIDNVRKAKINWNTLRWKEASKACLNFTKALLTVQEGKRLSAEEALRHEWLQASEDVVVPHFSDQMLVNISNFADAARLKQLAKVVIAHCAMRDFVQPYHDAFFAIDHDHSGRIDKKVSQPASRPASERANETWSYRGFVQCMCACACAWKTDVWWSRAPGMGACTAFGFAVAGAVRT